MTPTPVEVPRFGGLDFRSDPQELGVTAAIDMMNVDLDSVGRLRSRSGWGAVSAAGTFKWVFGFPRSSGNFDYLTHNGTTVASFHAGVGAGATVALSGTTPSAVRWGSPTVNRVYFTNGTTTIKSYSDAGVFAAPAGMPTTRWVSTSPIDNRLVAARTSTEVSKVSFSDAGAPETFGANNFVHLTPGDGENITGLCSVANTLYVFKQTKFFVFYSTDVDTSGNPVFNYRMVDGHGAFEAPCSVAAGESGVYFFDGRSIYVTNGSQAQRISDPIDLLLNASQTPPYYTGASIALTSVFGSDVRLSYANRRLYVAVQAAGSYYTLVYDTVFGFWLLWDMPMTSVIDYPYQSVPGVVLCAQSGDGSTPSSFVALHSPSATTDNLAAISSRYRTGFWNPGQPGAESSIREVLLDGTGTVTIKTAVNDAVTLGTGQTVTLGTSPAIRQGRDRRGVRGRNVSYEISGTGQWSVSRMEPLLRGQRATGLKAT